MRDKKIGDLYWNQLSMWDFSDEANIDAFSKEGFHYELMVITNVVSDNRWNIRNVKVSEISQSEIDNLTPKKDHNWSRVMGTNESLVTVTSKESINQ